MSTSRRVLSRLFWIRGAGVLYELTHWCSFTLELLGSVRGNKVGFTQRFLIQSDFSNIDFLILVIKHNIITFLFKDV